MDCSHYSIQELQQSLSSIDKNAYPKRYQELLAELNSRKIEYEAYRDEENDKLVKKIGNRLNILAWLQIATALGFIYAVFTHLFEPVNLVIFLSASILNGFAGYLLLKRRKLGFNLSFYNQVGQLFTFNLGFIYYSYSGLGYLAVVFQDGISFQGSILNPSFQFIWGSDLGFGVGLDLLALFFIFLLNTCKNEPGSWKS